MVDVVGLQNEIIKNPDHIVEILEAMEFTNIRDRGNYFQFPHKDGDNLTANSILKANLSWKDYTRNRGGSLITLVELDKNCKFPKALEYMAKWIGYKGADYHKKKIVKPFGGFYKGIVSDSDATDIVQLKTYPETILPADDCLSYLWLKDGVDLVTQKRYGIRLDLESDKILIPQYNPGSELIGVKARTNSNTCDLNKRWSMHTAFSKSLNLYGYNWNYDYIQDKSLVVISEAEKGVAQLSSMGKNLGVAIEGHNISDTQVKYIRSLFAKQIIVAFDAGLDEEEVRFEAKKLVKDSKIYVPNVRYIYDRDGIILKPELKQSPFDRGQEVLKILTDKNNPFLHKLTD